VWSRAAFSRWDARVNPGTSHRWNGDPHSLHSLPRGAPPPRPLTAACTRASQEKRSIYDQISSADELKKQQEDLTRRLKSELQFYSVEDIDRKIKVHIYIYNIQRERGGGGGGGGEYNQTTKWS